MSGPMRFGLHELKKAQDELLRRRAAHALDAARLAAGQRALSDHHLFLRAMQGVQPLNTPARHIPAPRTPTLRRGALAEAAASAAAPFSDAFEAPALIEDAHGWRRAGIGSDVLRRLRRGHWRVQAQLDLHGLRVDEARAALASFLHQCAAEGLRCVRIVHGKGFGSEGGRSVLKELAARWLQQAPQVRAFVQANPAAGGAGALLALLARPAPVTSGA